MARNTRRGGKINMGAYISIQTGYSKTYGKPYRIRVKDPWVAVIKPGRILYVMKRSEYQKI